MKNHKTITNIAWNTFGSIFYSLCQWLMTVVVIYIASFKEAGYLSIAMTTSSSFSAIALFSMRNYQVSDIKHEYSVHEYVGSRILTDIIALILCVSYSAIGNTGYNYMCICCFMAIRCVEAFVDVLHGQDQKYDKYNYIGISYFIRGTFSIVLFVVLLQFTQDMFITLIVIAFVNAVLAVVWDLNKTNALERIKPIIWNERIGLLLKNCVPLVVFSFLLSLENLIPKTTLENILGTEKLGIYSTIATPTLIVQVFASVVFNPFLPQFSRVYQMGDIKRFKGLILKLYIAFVALCVAVLSGAYLLGPYALSLVFGKQILEYYYLFMPIVIVTLLTGYIWVLSAVLIGMRKLRFLVGAITVCFLINIMITRPCIEMLDMNGASIAQVIPHSVLLLIMVVRVICDKGEIRDKEKDI